jgi:prepilin-type N-terminal cleavage/methylation domain-containing protein
MGNCSLTARSRHDAGMTLVEIMVTMIISSIIAASTFMFFAGQQRIYDTQTKVLNIQQNLWAAMEVVARFTRASGSGMYQCVRPASYINAAVGNGSRLLSTNPSPGPLTANLDSRPATGVRALNAVDDTMQWIPPLWIVNNSPGTSGTEQTLLVQPNSDIMTVAFGNRTSGTDIDATLGLNFADTNPGTLLSLVGANTGDMFRQWELVLLLALPDWGYGNDPNTDRGCTMLQISGNPQNSTILPHDSATKNPDDVLWNPDGDVAAMLPPGGYAESAAGVRNFGELNWVRFFIQRPGTGGAPNLMMQRLHLGAPGNSPEILAEGIEDFQVSYACDTGDRLSHLLTNVNGVLDEGTTDASKRIDEWWNNIPGDSLPTMFTPGFCNMPTAVRLTMVARTLLPDDLIDPAATGNGPLDVEDHHQTASPRPTDQFRRRVLSTTVYPRNTKPL